MFFLFLLLLPRYSKAVDKYDIQLPSVQDLSKSRWEEISFLKAGSFARGEGRRARQPGSRLQRTQKGPEPTRLWALESQRAHKQ